MSNESDSLVVAFVALLAMVGFVIAGLTASTVTDALAAGLRLP